jgi:hypothetical protein
MRCCAGAHDGRILELSGLKFDAEGRPLPPGVSRSSARQAQFRRLAYPLPHRFFRWPPHSLVDFDGIANGRKLTPFPRALWASL